MHRNRTQLAIVASLALAASCAAPIEAPRLELPSLTPVAHAAVGSDPLDRVADVAELTVPAVVHISSSRTVNTGLMDPWSQLGPRARPNNFQQRGAGSGVIVDSTGLVLTNNHVIAGADELVITLSDGRKFDGKVRGADPATDLALVEIEGNVPTDLPSMKIGDSESLRLGEMVLAIGSPFELQGTVTMGIVSARGRTGMGLARYEDFIQTDAAINPGNSGGALVNLNGELVGINTAINSRSGGYDGIGFAIPTSIAVDIVDQLRTDGKVTRGYLGVLPRDLTEPIARRLGIDGERGAIIGEVTAGSAADRAGLKTYDVITDIDGEAIRDANHLRNLVSMKGADAPIQLTIVRNGRTKKVRATLAAFPEGDTAQKPDSPAVSEGLLNGVQVIPLDERARRQLRADPELQGVVVVQVDPRSNAAQAGLRRGDVILEVDQRPVVDVPDLNAAVSEREEVMLLVQRNGMQDIIVLD